MTDTQGCAPSRRLRRLWIRLQVELHGQYSLDRLHQVQHYAQATSWRRVLALSVATPLPCLLVTLLLDCVRIEPVSTGPAHSPRLWTRCVFALWLFTLMLLVQLSQLVPHMAFSRCALVAISALASSLTIGVLYVLAMYVAYPLPFGGATGLVFWFAIVLGLVYLFRRRTPQAELRQFATLLLCQVAPTLSYTLYTVGYERVPATYQPLMILALPWLKLLTKNMISRSLQDVDDLKPEAVTFNIEIFHALFVACCMRTASTSLANIAALVTINAAQSALVLLDVRHIVKGLRPIQAKLRSHRVDVTLATLLRVAQFIAEKDRHVKGSQSFRASCFRAQSHVPSRRSFIAPVEALQLTTGSSASSVSRTDSHLRMHAKSASITASFSQITPVLTRPASTSVLRPSLMRIPSGLAIGGAAQPTTEDDVLAAVRHLELPDRLLLVRQTLQLYYVTEFISLVEYTEVIMPLVYACCTLIGFYLPNREFFIFLRDVDVDELHATVAHVLLYASLEMATLLGVGLVVWRSLQVPLFHQLAYVLDRQRINVQSKLIVWVIFVVQTSLVQLGSDYTFSFAWLRSGKHGD